MTFPVRVFPVLPYRSVFPCPRLPSFPITRAKLSATWNPSGQIVTTAIATNQAAAPGGMGGGTLFCVKNKWRHLTAWVAAFGCTLFCAKTQVAAPGGMGGGIWRHLVLCKNTGGTSPPLGLYNIRYNEGPGWEAQHLALYGGWGPIWGGAFLR